MTKCPGNPALSRTRSYERNTLLKYKLKFILQSFKTPCVVNVSIRCGKNAKQLNEIRCMLQSLISQSTLHRHSLCFYLVQLPDALLNIRLIV